MSKAVWNISFLFLVLGLMMTAAGLILRYYYRRKEQLSGHTRGRVIDLILREVPGTGSASFSNRYYPVLEFYANGKLYKENYPYGAYPSNYQVGDEVKIDYDPEDPHEYEIRKEDIYSLLPTILYGGGILLTVAGALLFIVFATRK